MLIHLLDPLDTDRHSSHLDKKMLPCIVKQSNEYLYRIMPFWRRYCLCVWMAWGALRTQENGSLRALNFKFSWGSMPPNPPSLVGANHSCKILDPPLYSTLPRSAQLSSLFWIFSALLLCYLLFPCSGEITPLPPMWPGFKSRCRRHMWVKFVVGSLVCSERFFYASTCIIIHNLWKHKGQIPWRTSRGLN